MLRLRGKREKVWTALWREDVLLTDGSTHRVRKQEVLGTLKEYKTRPLAKRALEQRLAEVNSLTYKPRIRGEVAAGRSNPIQTFDRPCRPVQD
jgi:hypothetical protein